jgi:Helix-turn-helix domain
MNQDDPFFLSRPFSRETLQLVDDVLLAVAGRIWEQTRDMAPPGAVVPAVNWQSEQRWQSPLGQNLLRVADYVNGGYSTTKVEVERAMKQIQRTLFGNPLGNDALLPDDFHKTALGKLFHQAYWQMVGRRGLMTPDEAFKELGISSRTTLYNRIYQRKLHPVYGPQGEMMLRRSEIEAWNKQRKAGRKKNTDSP